MSLAKSLLDPKSSQLSQLNKDLARLDNSFTFLLIPWTLLIIGTFNLPFVKATEAFLWEDSGGTSYKSSVVTVFKNVLTVIFWTKFIIKLHANLYDINRICNWK